MVWPTLTFDLSDIVHEGSCSAEDEALHFPETHTYVCR